MTSVQVQIVVWICSESDSDLSILNIYNKIESLSRSADEWGVSTIRKMKSVAALAAAVRPV